MDFRKSGCFVCSVGKLQRAVQKAYCFLGVALVLVAALALVEAAPLALEETFLAGLALFVVFLTAAAVLTFLVAFVGVFFFLIAVVLFLTALLFFAVMLFFTTGFLGAAFLITSLAAVMVFFLKSEESLYECC